MRIAIDRVERRRNPSAADRTSVRKARSPMLLAMASAVLASAYLLYGYSSPHGAGLGEVIAWPAFVGSAVWMAGLVKRCAVGSTRQCMLHGGIVIASMGLLAAVATKTPLRIRFALSKADFEQAVRAARSGDLTRYERIACYTIIDYRVLADDRISFLVEGDFWDLSYAGFEYNLARDRSQRGETIIAGPWSAMYYGSLWPYKRLESLNSTGCD